MDGLGNPLRFLLSSGNRHDICLAKEMLEPFDLTGKLILSDKAYDSDKFVCWVKGRGGIPVIPGRASARHSRKMDWHIYKEQHLIENLGSTPKLVDKGVLCYTPYGVIQMAANFTDMIAGSLHLSEPWYIEGAESSQEKKEGHIYVNLNRRLPGSTCLYLFVPFVLYFLEKQHFL